MAGIAPLIAQTLLEAGVVAWAGWELWKLRTPRKRVGRDDAEATPLSPDDSDADE